MLKLRLRQRGDTILEVMVCVAVIGLVLTTAFSLSNKSSTSQLKAQERSTALNIAETQLELLKSFAAVNDLPTDSYFCMEVDSNPANITGAKPVPLTGTNLPSSNKDSDLDTDYPNECRFDRNSVAGNPADILYDVIIWSPDKSALIGGAGNTPYGITVRWDVAGGGPKEELKTFYNLYNPSSLSFGVAGPPPTDCNDGVDNDGDGLIDFGSGPGNDPGCTIATDTDESDPPPPPPLPITDPPWLADGNAARTPPGSCMTNSPYASGSINPSNFDKACHTRFRNGHNTVFTYLNATYEYITSNLPSGCYQFTMGYGNKDYIETNDELAYYAITATLGSNPSQQLQLLTPPAYPGGKKVNYYHNGLFNLSGVSTLTFKWTNNRYITGESEGNFEIYNLVLQRVQCV